MELLQNRRCRPESISIIYLHEIKTHIESIIEVCQEGNISVYEADNVILEELLCCMDYQGELCEKLDNLKNDIEEPTTREYIEKTYWEGNSLLSFSPEELANLKDIGKKWRLSDLERALEDMEKYNNFLIEAQDKLGEMFESVDYQKKRKAGIKQQIIRDGITSSLEKADGVQTPEISIVDYHIKHLSLLFPEFANDYWLLIEKGFLEKTEKGLRKGDKIAKKFLADYFKSVNPPDKREVQWSIIELLFDEKDLKNSASSNGKKYKEGSNDFIRWLEIKKAHTDN